MKRTLAIILALVLALGTIFAFSSCGETKPTDDNNEVKTLKVAMECAYEPFNWTDLDNPSFEAVPIYGTNGAAINGQYANGYDVQIARYIAASLGMKLEIYALEWDSLIPAVQSGTVDAIIAGMSPTEERSQQITFSDVYYSSNLVVICKKGSSISSANSIADLSGAKIAAQAGTFHADALEQIAGATTSTYPEFADLLIALQSGAIDGYIAEEPTALALTLSDNTLDYIHLSNNDTGFTATDADVGIAVGLAKNSALVSQINTALANIPQETRMELMQQMVKLAAGQSIDSIAIQIPTK